MQKEKKINVAELAAVIEEDKSAAVKTLVDRFSDLDIDVNLLDDALENVLLADYVGGDGNVHEPAWKLEVAKAIALARRHLQELYETYVELKK